MSSAAREGGLEKPNRISGRDKNISTWVHVQKSVHQLRICIPVFGNIIFDILEPSAIKTALTSQFGTLFLVFLSFVYKYIYEYI